MTEKILILDFGSQYTQLIARRLRELNIYCEIKPYHIKKDTYQIEGLKGIIFSGSPASVLDENTLKPDLTWFELKIPILGICYGMQVISHLFGGAVNSSSKREFGFAKLSLIANQALFDDLENTQEVWMSHGDCVSKLPLGFTVSAKSESVSIAAFQNLEKNIYGIQFHPEVVHTKNGLKILYNFLYKICKMSGDWTARNFVASAINTINLEIGGAPRVICAISGGVDSTVAAVLVNKAIGNKLHCIFVANGLLRLNEVEQVSNTLKNLGLNLQVISAKAQFLTALKGIVDPEQKRKIIGNKFIEIFEAAAKKIGGVTHLVQGTLYPDVIESVSVGGPSDTIKTHHNVGGLPEKMHLKLIEPFRFLFKDEVRLIGKELGVPDNIVNRQPFPGPGLAVRCLGEVTEENLETLKKADYIFQEEIKSTEDYATFWQSFVVLLPIKSVGVMGDARTYENCLAIRNVTSNDGMTADWAYLPEALLRKISTKIINEVKGINRVVYDISSKPPATIEWE